MKTVEATAKIQTHEENKSAGALMYLYRGLAILMFVLLFVPALNPAKISGLINRSTSLLTAGISWAGLTENFGRAFKKGWVLESTMRTVWISCMVACVGILMAGAGGCLSLGNNKCRKLGAWLSTIGAAAATVSMAGIYRAYGQISLTEKANKVKPMFPTGFWYVVALFAVMTAVALILLIRTPKPAAGEKFAMEAKFRLFLMLLPFLMLAFVFCYLPLLGWRYAFFDYKAGDTLSMENFVGLKWFAQLVRNKMTRSDLVRVLRNTLVMSFLGISMSWLPMAFAIFLSEIKNSKYRRVVQTFTTIPNFISWVLVFAIAFSIFSTDGFVSSLMQRLGIWSQGKNFLMSGDYTWLKMWAWGTWKGLGWSAIIYIAGISGIDQQLYEAATVDGAGRFQKMWHITVPGLLPTFFVLLLMSVAAILSNGMDQYLVFENSTNSQQIMVLDLYVYKMGIVNGAIPLSTAVGMLKSVISVALLLFANGISKLIRGETIM